MNIFYCNLEIIDNFHNQTRKIAFIVLSFIIAGLLRCFLGKVVDYAFRKSFDFLLTKLDDFLIL